MWYLTRAVAVAFALVCLMPFLFLTLLLTQDVCVGKAGKSKARHSFPTDAVVDCLVQEHCWKQCIRVLFLRGRCVWGLQVGPSCGWMTASTWGCHPSELYCCTLVLLRLLCIVLPAVLPAVGFLGAGMALQVPHANPNRFLRS